MIRFSEISDLSEPTYARYLIGGEQKMKNRKTSIFNEGPGLCGALFLRIPECQQLLQFSIKKIALCQVGQNRALSKL